MSTRAFLRYLVPRWGGPRNIVALSPFFFLALGSYKASAIDELLCIQKRPIVVDEAALQMLNLTHEIKNALALPQDVAVIPCASFGGEVAAFYQSQELEGVPAGDYILYNPSRLQQTVGSDKTQAIFLVGRELGHFAAEHLNPTNAKPQRRKALEADGYGACAVARLQGGWTALRELITRLRNEYDDLNPSRAESLFEVEKQFQRCGGQVPNVSVGSSAAEWHEETIKRGETVYVSFCPIGSTALDGRCEVFDTDNRSVTSDFILVEAKIVKESAKTGWLCTWTDPFPAHTQAKVSSLCQR